MHRTLLAALGLLALAATGHAEPHDPPPPAHLTRFAAGTGPRVLPDGYRLLDDARTPGQSNAVAFDADAFDTAGARESLTLTCTMHVLAGGDGGAFLFLNANEYGARGPAPFVSSWVEPNLRKSLGVGIDVHNPPSKEMFTPWGNYQGLPQREVSLHWDGREIVKRVAPVEFRDKDARVRIHVQQVVGGAEVDVEIGGRLVYDHEFVPGVVPYPSRLAIGAGTRKDATTQFQVTNVAYVAGPPAKKRRPPLHVEVFNHVLTNNKKTAYTAEVALPPAGWAFGRVLLTLDLHDAGKHWDEWDRNGEISIWLDEKTKVGLVPFITSYRTPCHWVVDVSAFRPWLAGKRRIEIAAGTTFYKNRGFMMSVSLDFFHGTPDLEPFRITPLWNGSAHHGAPENHYRDFFPPRTVAIDASTKTARVYLSVTGHSQVGEFTPEPRTLVFKPEAAAEAEVRFENTLWKTDCYLNPHRPQFGTWQFSRAGWAPGDVVRPWWVDLGDAVVSGKPAQVRYEPGPYDVSAHDEPPSAKDLAAANQVVRSYLIEYRAPGALVAAPTLRVTNVARGSNAAKAGIRTGDYLARYDGRRLDAIEDLRAALGAAVKAGKTEVRVVLYRGSERLDLTLAAGRMGINLATR